MKETDAEDFCEDIVLIKKVTKELPVFKCMANKWITCNGSSITLLCTLFPNYQICCKFPKSSGP